MQEKVSPPPLPGQREKRAQSRSAAHGAVTLNWVDSEENAHAATARIRDDSPRGLGVYADVELPRDTYVWVVDERDGDEQRKAVVQYSRRRAGHWKIGLVFVNQERRRVERFPVSGKAKLSWGYIVAEGYECEAVVLNVSQIGALVETEQKIPIDARVQLEGDALECMGYVRHTTPRDGRFLIGLQFAAEPMTRGRRQRVPWEGISIQYP